jgi:hypothetical protein
MEEQAIITQVGLKYLERKKGVKLSLSVIAQLNGGDRRKESLCHILLFLSLTLRYLLSRKLHLPDYFASTIVDQIETGTLNRLVIHIKFIKQT